jgi:hypothetical protein
MKEKIKKKLFINVLFYLVLVGVFLYVNIINYIVFLRKIYSDE